MDASDYRFYMHDFVNSKEFAGRDVERVGDDFIDRSHPNLRYFRAISDLNEVDPEVTAYDTDDRIIPTVYLSENPKVLKRIGGTKYNLKAWPVSRMNEVQGFEFDYAYLHQCEALHRRPFCYWPGTG